MEYCAEQERRSIAIQKLASQRRAGTIDAEEARRELTKIQGRSPTVYDGSRLLEAVKLMVKKLK